MNNSTIIDQLTAAYKKEFGNAYFIAKYRTNLCNSIGMSFGIQEKGKHENNIIQNDPAWHSVIIFGFDDEGNTTDDMEVSSGSGGSIAVRPPEGSYLCYGRVKTGFRKKKKATGEQITKHMINYFKKLRKVVNEQRENIKVEVC